ncbi:SixA phosphatase family protein [Streptomyces aculeolatus]|jgi:phosphohistidine phosphatase|uniref:SixA phosphatase family protein n=1 Tax=Streptomyces aculeolatus TaxID=270689 RepID=UPI000426CD62|nr:histidine phosphatase family protein [Streptomyces aculeolatus]
MSAGTPRSIVLLRHAKADWAQDSDHERPLAERGRADAPAAGDFLAAHDIDPDLTLCSSAKRTRETWKLVVGKLPRRPRTVYEERLYEASLGELIQVLNEVPDDVSTLLVIGHNPGMHGLADALAGSAEGDTLSRLSRGFPTSGVAVVEFAGSWKSVEHGVGRLTEFWTPHQQ